MKKWALHNALKDWILYDLSERETQLIINTLSSSEVKLVRIADSENLNWQVLDLHQHQFLFSQTGKASLIFKAPDEVSISEDTITDFLSEQVPKNIIPRLHKRVQKEYLVSIHSNQNMFTTRTCDFSIGGLHLKDELPAWVSGYFIVELKTEFEVFKLLCSVVEDQKNRLRVQIMNEEHEIPYLKYKKWFQSSFDEV